MRKPADEQGRHLEVMPDGSKYWSLTYRVGGKENRMALGVYPTVTLLAARKARDEVKAQLRGGLDPSHEKKRVKLQRSLDRENSFEPIARAWHEQRKGTWSERHVVRVMNLLERELFPLLGARPIAEISAPELLEVMRKIGLATLLNWRTRRSRRAARSSGMRLRRAGQSTIRRPISVAF
ncbi:tyrosine-type recombinase/integrase [Burkholderia alba]|uniref:tyrosine-type recombinase/integrase n=1 Tax=Burkholderia alba TaxID=2683677 RepID=UPI002B0539BB|nr:Arm DNA-binding domain-containing protein [Burkholderia alba]